MRLLGGVKTKFMNEPFCCRCKEEFQVAEEPTGWTMGMLRKLLEAPKWIQQLENFLKDKIGEELHLCGNCYFDLTDE